MAVPPSMLQELQQLVNRFPALSQDQELQSLCKQEDVPIPRFIALLCGLILKPELTVITAAKFRSCLLHVVVQLSHSAAQQQPAAFDALQWLAFLKIILFTPKLFSSLSLEACTQSAPFSVPGIASFSHLEQLLFACKAALHTFPRLVKGWSPAALLPLLSHQVAAVRCTAAELLAALLKLSEASKTSLVAKCASQEEALDALLRYDDFLLEIRMQQSAVWLCHCGTGCPQCKSTVQDAEKVLSLISANPDQLDLSQLAPSSMLPPPAGYVSIAGLYLPCTAFKSGGGKNTTAPASHAQTHAAGKSGGFGKVDSFVRTPSAQRNLEAVVLGVCEGAAVLLEGPEGCGKTALLQELAHQTGNQEGMITIHLDDQLDSKSLLGAYLCTSVPGEFAWQPGPLAQAVMHGKWVLIENIHLAPAEVLACLTPLLESKTLHLPSRGTTLQAAPGFQLLATISSDAGGVSSSLAKDALAGLWSHVRLETPTDEEMLTILAAKFPSLSPLLPHAVAMLSMLKAAATPESLSAGTTPTFLPSTALNTSATCTDSQYTRIARAVMQAVKMQAGELMLHVTRHVSLRDLMKWCQRLQVTLGTTAARLAPHLAQDSPLASAINLAQVDLSVREAAFQEAADCFAAALSADAPRQKLLLALSSLWALPDTAVRQYEELHKPAVHLVQGRELQIGRTVLPLLQPDAGLDSGSGTYARTGHVMRLLERVAVATSQAEVVLLVGETGTGKSTMVTQLAAATGAKLLALNMSQQTDSSDLLGGFKPISVQDILLPLLPRFQTLVRGTWTKGNNEEFLARASKFAERKKWSHLLQAFRAAVTKILPAAAEPSGEGPPSKKRKTNLSDATRRQWSQFSTDLSAVERAANVAEGGFAFAFVEGKLVQAVREGWWLLLDEINLAPQEVLERIAGLLESPEGSLTLLERGDLAAVPRHPNFRLFAAMNPATDAGKHQLAAGFRSRFTEIWVGEPPLKADLAALVAAYLSPIAPKAPVDEVVELYLAAKTEAAAHLSDGAGQKPAYNLRTLCRALEYARCTAPTYGLQRALFDGFSMSFLTQLQPESAPRLEALLHKYLLPGVKSAKSILRPVPEPSGGRHVLFEHFWLEKGPLPLPEGGREDDGQGHKFVITESVRQHLTNIARATLIRKHPILLQGPTSSGKTSLVVYLAAQTGHKFVRINNHQHTDLAEYLGTYVPDETGRLVFREGLLVQALRHGWWIVLDELNLAPTQVLEALNRLLDDNRELFVPELQEVVKPHPHFMLFATQNPPGIYAGRKILSRAFRSRFLELHVGDIPDSELTYILQQRCSIAPSYAAKLVTVMRELQRQRQSTNVFAGKHGFITPRDLFRWAERGAVGYEELACHGFMVLGERLRTAEERGEVSKVLQKTMRVNLDMDAVYQQEGSGMLAQLQESLSLQEVLTADQHAARNAINGLVWTPSMRRMFTLVNRCLTACEPVLLVGETGGGKTTVCQLLAALRSQRLHILNCNQHTETSDFLGSFRPSRHRDAAMGTFVAAVKKVAASPAFGWLQAEPPTIPDEIGVVEVQAVHAAVEAAVAVLSQKAAAAGQLPDHVTGELAAVQAAAAEARESVAEARTPFTWVDGPLVTAMKQGDMILVDEINLAEDAVLERLNSVLEPSRTLTLAEKGGQDGEVIKAAPGFRLLATMNPGGDFGKKELSPALSNRFTTIWVPTSSNPEELRAILQSRLKLADEESKKSVANHLLAFWSFYTDHASGGHGSLTIRDLLSWVDFINTTGPNIGPIPAYVHGAYLTVLDGVGLGAGMAPAAAQALRKDCHKFLLGQLGEDWHETVLQAAGQLSTGTLQASGRSLGADEAGTSGMRWGIPPFFLSLGENSTREELSGSYELGAPTTAANLYRILRSMQLRKAILLEGSPGVGKTSLVSALSRASGHNLVRINLSEQTDMMDLLGADLPAPDGAAAQFVWCDGPLLAALKSGAWVLLDELNLASQSVLEGLNALLDHRAEVFIPELGAVYRCHPHFRLFAAQNPVQEGGGRKGLPRSFLNRFIRVHIQSLHPEDLHFISTALHSSIPQELLQRMVRLLSRLHEDANERRLFGVAGGPWEFNLRDLLRWCHLVDRAVGRHEHKPPGRGASQQEQTTLSSIPSQQHDPAPTGDVSMVVSDVNMVNMEVSDVNMAKSDDATVAGMSGESGPLVACASADVSTGSGQLLLPYKGGAVHSLREEARAGPAGGCADVEDAVKHFAVMLFHQRLRSEKDRLHFAQVWDDVWGSPFHYDPRPCVAVTPHLLIVGRAGLTRPGAQHTDMHAQATSEDDAELRTTGQLGLDGAGGPLALLSQQTAILESLLHTVQLGWMSILVGPSASNKTSVVRALAQMVGVPLLEMNLTPDTDTSDLLGSFEQLEPHRHLAQVAEKLSSLSAQIVEQLLVHTNPHGSTAHTHDLTHASPHAAVAKSLMEACQQLSDSQGANQTLANQTSKAPPAGLVDGDERLQQAVGGVIRVMESLPVDTLQLTQGLATAIKSVCSHARNVLSMLPSDNRSSPAGTSAPSQTAGRFEWVDGAVSRAIEHGGWVLLDNANMCNPTVLDRLNPLLEPGGVLYLNEAGNVGGRPRVIRPHPNFRLFLAMDTQHGEVSRAMRNRGMELFLLAETADARLPVVTPGSTRPGQHATDSVFLSGQQGVSQQPSNAMMQTSHLSGTRGQVGTDSGKGVLAGPERVKGERAVVPGALEAVVGVGDEVMLQSICCPFSTFMSHLHSAVESSQLASSAVQNVAKGAHTTGQTSANNRPKNVAEKTENGAPKPGNGNKPEKFDSGVGPYTPADVRDVLSVLALEGVQGRGMLLGMAAVHLQSITVASKLRRERAQRQSLGIRQLRSWASLSLSLIERGWSMPAALHTSWMHVYLRGVSKLDAREIQTMQSAIQSLLMSITKQSGETGQGQGVGVNASSRNEPTADISGRNESTEDMESEGEGDVDREQVGGGPEQRALLHGLGGNGSSKTLLVPGLWPLFSPLHVFSSCSEQSVAVQNVSVLTQLAWEMMSASGANASGNTRELSVLAHLPAAIISQQLHTGRVSQPITQHVSALTSSAIHQLGRICMKAAMCMAGRSTHSTAALTLHMLEKQLAMMRAVLHPGGDERTQRTQNESSSSSALSTTGMSPVAQTAVGAVQLALNLLRHPWSERLKGKVREQGGVWSEMKPLDTWTYLGFGSCDWQTMTWRLLASHVAQASQQQAAIDAAPHQVARHTPSPYQCSYWAHQHRGQQPLLLQDHQALQDALFPAMEAALQLQQAALEAGVKSGVTDRPSTTLPNGPSSSSSSQTASPQAGLWAAGKTAGMMVAAEQLLRLQALHAELWWLCHEGFEGSSAQEGTLGSFLHSLAWVWSKTVQTAARLIASTPRLSTWTELPRMEYAFTNLSEALGLHANPAKPLMWRHGGHPLQPTSAAVFGVHQFLVKVAHTLQTSANGFPPHTLGCPAILEAAGLQQEWRSLLQDLPTRESVSAEELADTVATAVTSALVSDTGLRRRVLGALSIVSSLPVLAALGMQGQGDKVDVEEMGRVLKELLLKRAKEVCQQVVAHGTTEDKPTPGSTTGTASQGAVQLLPPELMVSPACCHMQLQLMQLQDLHSIRRQHSHMAAALHLVLQLQYSLQYNLQYSPFNDAKDASSVQHQLLGVLRDMVRQGVECGGRSPLDFAPHQQLEWTLDALRDAHQPQQLVQQLKSEVLPAAMNAWCFRWHTCQWTNTPLATSAQEGLGLRNDGSQVVHPASLVMQASLCQLIPAMMTSATSSSPTRTARLLQLSLTVKTLYQAASTSGALQSASQQLTASWHASAAVVSHTLLAHLPVIPSQNDKQAILQLATDLLTSHTQLTRPSSPSDGPASDSHQQPVQEAPSSVTKLHVAKMLSKQVVEAAGQVLGRCEHAVLRKVAPLLQRCLQFVHSCAGVPAGHGFDSGCRSELGQAWMLVGCARLHLSVPPPSIDPAGKFALKRDFLLRFLLHVLDAEIMARSSFDALNLAPSEKAVVQQLREARENLQQQLATLSRRCVLRPDPPQYTDLQKDISSFAAHLGSQERVTKLLLGLSGGSSTGSSSNEAEAWLSNSAAWMARIQQQYPHYADIWQPVLLAVQEIRLGLSVLLESYRNSRAQAQVAMVSRMLAGLLSFPAVLHAPGHQHNNPATPSQGLVLPVNQLGHPKQQAFLESLVNDGLDKTTQVTIPPGKGTAALSLQLSANRTALHYTARLLLLQGSGCADITPLQDVFDNFTRLWQAVKDWEEAQAEEEAQIYKTKTRTSTFTTEEEDDEESYKEQFPDHFATFDDLLPDDPDMDLPEEPANTPQPAADTTPEISAAKARHATTKSLLDGAILQDLVDIHAAVFSFLAGGKPAGEAVAGAVQEVYHRGPGGAKALYEQFLGESGLGAKVDVLDEGAVQKMFLLAYQVGSNVMKSVNVGLPPELDDITIGGHLMRVACEHAVLASTPMSHSSLAARSKVLQAMVDAQARKHAERKAKTTAASLDQTGAVDMQQPAVEEAALMVRPVSSMAKRVAELLEEWPDHPLLVQLDSICARILDFPHTVPLKQLLTGLELILAKAQVWEESAAKHVSLSSHLSEVAALAVRWRRLELASWEALLDKVKARHAAGANRSWFYLYTQLAPGREAVDGSTGEERESLQQELQRTAATLDAFMQTSTLGEYAARLKLLHSFRCHLEVTQHMCSSTGHGNEGTSSSTAANQSQRCVVLSAIIHNVLCYYSQFLPAVRKAVDAGLSAVEKDLKDFIKLAKWEDRGYYAMRASNEKAQRHLHRLSRRGEAALAEPAATVLAAAYKNIGVDAFPSSTPAAKTADGDADEAPPGSPIADSALTSTTAKGDSNKSGKKGKTGASLTLVTAPEHEAGTADVELWRQFSRSCIEAARKLSDAPEAQPGSTDGNSTAGHAGYLVKLARLTERMVKILETKVSASHELAQTEPPTVPLSQGPKNADGAAPQAPVPAGMRDSGDLSQGLQADVSDQQQDSVGGAEGADEMEDALEGSAVVQCEELAGLVLQRSAELKADVSKGAKLRKKKALTDFLKALAQVGVSRLAEDVPPEDRTVNAWFQQASPQLPSTFTFTNQALLPSNSAAPSPPSLQLTSIPLPPSTLHKVQQLWHKADSYFFRSVAAIQKLWSVSKAPSPEVAPHEVRTALRYSEHVLYLQRKQRVMLRKLSLLLSDLDTASHTINTLQTALSTATSSTQPSAVISSKIASGNTANADNDANVDKDLNAGKDLNADKDATADKDANASVAHQGSTLATLSVLPPQDFCQKHLTVLKNQLDTLQPLLQDFLQLHTATEAAAPVSTPASTAAHKLAQQAHTTVTKFKDGVDAIFARLERSRHALITGNVLTLIQNAYDEVVKLDVAVRERAAELTEVACWDRVATAVHAAAVDANTFVSTLGLLERSTPVALNTPHLPTPSNTGTAGIAGQRQEQLKRPAGTTDSAGQQQEELHRLSERLEGVVKSLLIWAQPVAKAVVGGTQGTQGTQDGVGVGSGHIGASGIAGVGGNGGTQSGDGPAGTIVGVQAELEAAVRIERGEAVLAGVTEVMQLLREMSNEQRGMQGERGGEVLRGAVGSVVKLLPMLRLMEGTLSLLLVNFLQLHKSTAKLGYVSTVLFATLVEQGFCVPDQSAEGESGDGDKGEWKEAEGTGLGEGEGAKDISDQIKDQDQLLGAKQKDQQEQEQQDEKDLAGDDDKGIEMDDDFEGQLHDVDMEGQDNRDSEDEEGDTDRIEQQMGDVGDNEEVVDEKLWDEDDDQADGKEEGKKEEKYEKDAPIQVEDATDLEYRGGADEDEQQQDKQDKGQDKQEKKPQPGQEDVQDEEMDEQDGDGDDEGVNEDFDDKYEDKHFAKPTAPEEEMQLPEDMNLDEEEEGEEGGGEEQGQEEGEEREEQMQEAAAPEQDKAGDEGNGEEEDGGDDDGKEVAGENPEREDGPEEGAGAAQGKLADEEKEEEEDVEKERQDTDAEPIAVDEPEAEAPEDQQEPVETGPKGQAGGPETAQATQAGASAETQEWKPDEDSAEGREREQAKVVDAADAAQPPAAAPKAQQSQVGAAEDAGKGGAPTPLEGNQGQKQQQANASQPQPRDPNPLRSLGDAMEQWFANLPVQHEQQEQENGEDGAQEAGEENEREAGEPRADEYQFMGEKDQAVAGETQALTSATAEQAKEMEALQREEGMGEEDGEDVAAKEEERREEEEEQDGNQAVSAAATWSKQHKGGKQQVQEDGGDKAVQEEDMADAEREEAFGDGAADRDMDSVEDQQPSLVSARIDSEMLQGREGTSSEDHLPATSMGLTQEQEKELLEQLDERIRAAAGAGTSGVNDTYGQEVWSKCEALTEGLASELVERLRLILEPTLATRLAGEYRSGKRISMKRVIAYIASQFRKDKIWLRRTRPDKRKYQVVLALDSSKSMVENGCASFAIQAMAVICKAISRLEVGQVGVVSFGGTDGVQPLHLLDQPFTESVGPKLAGALRFSQDNTIADRPVLSLIQSLQHILTTARHSAGSAGSSAARDLHQLVLVLADGRFHEKESLRAAVRAAATQPGVCLAFIILDNPQSSLLETKSVSFVGGKPEFSNYLDSFPFPYYVLLRDIAALPHTLADLLRQWFELSGSL